MQTPAGVPMEHGHPVLTMLGGLIVGLLLGVGGMYYWQETLAMKAQEEAQAQAQALAEEQAQEEAAAAAAAEAEANPLEDVQLNPFE